MKRSKRGVAKLSLWGCCEPPSGRAAQRVLRPHDPTNHTTERWLAVSLPDTETFTTNSFAIVRNEFTPTCHTPGRKRERLVALQQGDSPADAFRRWAADEGGDVDNFGDVSWTGERDADLLEWVDEDEYAGIELRATCGDDGERLAVTFTARRERGFRAKMRR